MLDRTLAPPFHPVADIRLPEAEKIVLANGTNLFAVSSGRSPVMSIDLYFDAGTRRDTMPGAGYLALKMLQEGTAKHSAKQLADKLAFYGAFPDLSHSADRMHVSLHSLCRFLPELLPVLDEMITESVFPEAELETQKNILVQHLRVNEARNSYLASVGFRAALFGENHPYGHSLTETQTEALSRPVLLDFYQKFIQNAPMEIIVAGQVGDKEYDLIDKMFGSRKFTPKPAADPSKEKLHPGKSVLIEREDAKQSSIRLGRIMFNRKHPDYFQLRLLTEVLGGYFGSRLMKNIREDKGYTYGIYAQVVPMEKTGYFIIGSDVGVQHTQAALDEIRKEIKILQTDLIPAAELETVRNYMLGTFASSLNSPFALADKFKSIHFEGLDYSWYKKMLAAYRSITAEELRETARKYLREEDMTEVVAGKK